MKRVVVGLAALALSTGVWADQIADATLRAQFPIGTPATWETQRVGTPGYSNVTTFSGSGFQNGGADATNQITKLVADDIGNTLPGEKMLEFTFSVANFDTANISARARIRLYADNAGSPGASIVGYSFNPLTFTPGVGLWTATVDPNTAPILPAAFWAGLTFDNVNPAGGTTATPAQLNLLGQGLFNPPTLGASADVAFITTTPGSHLVNNPPGSTFNFSGNPIANFGWDFKLTPEPTGFLLAGFAVLLIRRRR